MMVCPYRVGREGTVQLQAQCTQRGRSPRQVAALGIMCMAEMHMCTHTTVTTCKVRSGAVSESG